MEVVSSKTFQKNYTIATQNNVAIFLPVFYQRIFDLRKIESIYLIDFSNPFNLHRGKNEREEI